MRFVPASDLYDVATGERLPHPDAGATDAEVRAGVRRLEEGADV